MSTPTWLYHAKHGAQLFDADVDDMPKLAKAGWKDAPVETEAEDAPVEQVARKVHRGRGKYDVFDAAGIQVADNVTKTEANDILEAL